MSTFMAFLYLLLDPPEYWERVLVTTYRRWLREVMHSREAEHASQNENVAVYVVYLLVYVRIDSATNYARRTLRSFETIRGDSSR